MARRTRRWSDKVRIFVKPPGWRPADVPFEPTAYSPVQGLKYDARPAPGLRAYAVATFLMGLGGALALLFFEARLATAEEVALALLSIWSLLAAGALFDGRPWALPSEVAQYKMWQRRRLSVRPGLTCFWQVGGRNAIGFEEWMRLDLQYVDTWTLGLDLRLILMTFPVVVAGKGAS